MKSTPNDRERGPNQKHRLLPVCPGIEAVLDRHKHLGPDSGARLADCGGEPQVVASQRGWEGLGGAEEGRHTGSHLAQRIEDAVHDHEQREHSLNGPEGATEDETPHGPEHEPQRHVLLAADPVHQPAADQATGKVEAIDDGLVRQIVFPTQDPDGRLSRPIVLTPYPMLSTRVLSLLSCWIIVDEKSPNGYVTKP